MDLLTLVARLTLDSSEYERGLSGAGETAGKIAKGIGVALTAATTAVTGFAASSVNAGMSFDKSMSQVAATMGKSTDEIKDLRDFAQEMGSTTAFSATQAADALNYMALAGYDSNKSMQMLPNVLNLAAAGNMDLAAASDMVTDASSALGLNMAETEQLVDKMAKTSSKSNTSVSQLGDAMLTIGGTAKSLSGGTTELSAALGILADNGIKGSEGGTALRNVILSLTAPTDKARAVMKELGLNVNDANGNMRPLSDIMGDLNKKLGTMSASDRTQVLNELFNKVDLKSVNALMATNVGRWNELTGAIDNSKGAAEEMANTQLDNLAGDITLFKSALEGAQIAVSDELTPTLRTFVEFGTKSLSGITAAFKEDGLSGAIDYFGVALGQAVQLINGMLPTLVTAGAQFLGAVVQGLIVAIPSLFEAAHNIVMSLANYLLSAIPQIGPTLQTMMVSLRDLIIQHGPEMLNAAAKIIIALGEGIVQNLQSLVAPALDIIKTLATGISQAIPDLIPTIVDVELEIFKVLTDPSNLQAILQAGIEILLALVEGVLQAIPHIVEAVPVIITNMVNALYNNLPYVIEAALKIVLALARAIVDYAPKILEAGKQLISSLITAFTEGVPKVVEKAKNIVGHFVKGIKDLLPNVLTIGGEIVNKLRDGIANAKNKVTEKVKSITDTIKDKFTEAKNNAKTWGGNIIGNLVSGIGSAIINVTNIVGKITDSIKRGIETAINTAVNWGKGLLNNFINGIAQSFGNLGDTLNRIVEIIFGYFRNVGSNALTWGRDMVQNFINGIGDKLNALANKVSEFAGKIKNAVGFSEPKEGPLSDFHTYAPDMMELFAKGITDNAGTVLKAVEDAFDFSDTISNVGLGSTRTGFNLGAGAADVISLGSGGSKNVTVVLELDKAELGRTTFKLYNEESQRYGVRLGGVYS